MFEDQIEFIVDQYLAGERPVGRAGRGLLAARLLLHLAEDGHARTCVCGFSADSGRCAATLVPTRAPLQKTKRKQIGGGGDQGGASGAGAPGARGGAAGAAAAGGGCWGRACAVEVWLRDSDGAGGRAGARSLATCRLPLQHTHTHTHVFSLSLRSSRRRERRCPCSHTGARLCTGSGACTAV